MKEKRLMVLIGSISLLLVGVVTSLLAAAVPPKPGALSITCSEIGTGTHIDIAAVSQGIQQKFGIKIRYLPLGQTAARTLAVRTGAYQFFVHADAVYARDGLSDYGTLEWGPQPIRIVWAVRRLSFYSLATQANSGIKKPADLKGRKIGFIIGSPGANTQTETFLIFGGLTWKDVQKVDFPGLTESYKGLLDGKIDATCMSSESSHAYQMESSPNGLYWVPLDPNNAEGMAWLAKAGAHFFVDSEPTLGAGVSKAKPARNVLNFPYPVILTYDHVSDDVTYWFAKAINESYDEYKNVSASAPQWHIDKMFECKPLSFAAVHPGVVKYFHQIGRWTSELQAQQNKVLEHDRQVKKLWDAAVIEASEKGIPEKQWYNFWLEKRKAAGL